MVTDFSRNTILKQKNWNLTPGCVCLKYYSLIISTIPNFNIKLLVKIPSKSMPSKCMGQWQNLQSEKIQVFQNISLRKITYSPPYISNQTHHTDLRLKSVQDEAKYIYKKFHAHLINSHKSLLIHQLSTVTIAGNPPNCLKIK